ncbi:hypothetical protein NL676_009564 [Syzygium grande]|nr:hypothetical protein NL676_009564 [Syzygium grande]
MKASRTGLAGPLLLHSRHGGVTTQWLRPRGDCGCRDGVRSGMESRGGGGDEGNGKTIGSGGTEETERGRRDSTPSSSAASVACVQLSSSLLESVAVDHPPSRPYSGNHGGRRINGSRIRNKRNEGIKEGEEGEEEKEEEAWSSDSEIENPLDWLDLKDGVEAVADGAFAASEYSRGASHSCPVVPRFNRCPIGARNSPVAAAPTPLEVLKLFFFCCLTVASQCLYGVC